MDLGNETNTPEKPDELLHRWMYENGTARELSITDHFAAQALVGLITTLAIPLHRPSDLQDIASKSYDLAEAMVRERSKRYTQ